MCLDVLRVQFSAEHLNNTLEVSWNHPYYVEWRKQVTETQTRTGKPDVQIVKADANCIHNSLQQQKWGPKHQDEKCEANEWLNYPGSGKTAGVWWKVRPERKNKENFAIGRRAKKE